jgi:hypothetical protein
VETVNRIRGHKTVSVFESLYSRRSPVRLYVFGKDYERLTIVTGLRPRDGRLFILVDLPGGFEIDVPEWAGKRVLLEFVDRDRIPHSCRTEIRNVEGDDLWLDLPDHVDRIQRRRHFRVQPPAGSRVLFRLLEKNIEAPVLDISLGGGRFVGPGKQDSGPVVLEAGLVLNDLLLVGPLGNGSVQVEIEQARVVRVEKLPETGRVSFAAEFSRLGMKEEAVLERFIYHSQRRLLRKRSVLEE